MSIKNMKPGERASILHVGGDGSIRQRLLDMGFMPDVVIEMERVAPMGNPVWVKLRGTQITLRDVEAEAIHVTRVDKTGV